MIPVKVFVSFEPLKYINMYCISLHKMLLPNSVELNHKKKSTKMFFATIYLGSETLCLTIDDTRRIIQVSYHGKGLESGECGFKIQKAQDKNNGVVKCTLGIPSELSESVGQMQLIVASKLSE